VVKFSIRKTVSWPTGPEVRHQPIDGGAMLYDTSRVGNAEQSWFVPGWWSQRGTVRASVAGRGSSWFIDADGRRMVLRRYRRGGFIARLSVEHYLWQGAEETRSFAEWHLLYAMRRVALPVPVPLAASYRRVGRHRYEAALLTEEILGVSSLAALLAAAPLPLSAWIAVGRGVRRFHEDGVCHADLNAHNVLLGHAHEMWLVDFDRGRLRRPGMWCDSNLVRLRRSVEKLTAALPAEHFTEADWSSLLSGYFSAAPTLSPAQ
jgi:3-deoxy-D-manno-octulosonic acid kinase